MSDWAFRRPNGLPLPQPAPESEPFFKALRHKRLVMQRCAQCLVFAHPPRALCGQCRGTSFEWCPMSGRGTVYSYVVTHQAVHPAFEGHTPFATVEVALEEGPHLISNIVDVPPEEVVIGMVVEVVFQTVSDTVVLPLFRHRA